MNAASGFLKWMIIQTEKNMNSHKDPGPNNEQKRFQEGKLEAFNLLLKYIESQGMRDISAREMG